MSSSLLGKKEKKEKEQEHDLYSASYAGDLVSVRAALDSGQSANTRGEYDWTCLMAAVIKGSEEVFRVILHQEDCDPSLGDSDKWTALHYACGYGRVGMVRQLASHPRQGSLNSKDSDGETAIMTAVRRGHADCVLALGRLAGVDLDTRDSDGESLEEKAR